MEVILLRYGEIALKGGNRINFENRLRFNVIEALHNSCKISKIPGRYLLHSDSIKKASQRLVNVFGLTSISIAEEINLDLDAIKEECLLQSKKKRFDTFRVSVQRLVKKLKPSPELEKDIGAYIVEKTGKKVKLKGADLDIHVEIAEKAYIFTEKMPCLGGLPVGIEGNVALLIDTESDENMEKSVLAGLLMMKRGCMIMPFAFKKTDKTGIGILAEYGCNKTLNIVEDIKVLEKTAHK
ncbi:MAG: THUMP domain-containing protein, partial [Candidatus Woesearchaeota archaeon]|nr:THUMP domain-containing protein [Candidatus Woesearchaeota archaeon]